MSDEEKRRRAQRAASLRESFGWTQDELAAKSAGLTRNAISKMENEHNSATGKKLLRGVATAYGATVETLDDYLSGRINVEQFWSRVAVHEDPLAGATISDLADVRKQIEGMPESFTAFLRSKDAAVFTLSDVSRVAIDYKNHPTTTQPGDLAPHGGWGKYFVSVLRQPARAPQVARKPGAVALFDDIEVGDLPTRAKNRRR